MAGYSGTPLAKKLGIGPGTVVGLSSPPPGFARTLDPLPDDVSFSEGTDPADVVLCFATEASDLSTAFHAAMRRIPADGAIWAAWPKRASKVPTDIDGNRCREMFLPTGMVDVKVCAIDDTWSALRFVVRTENRPTWHGSRS